MWHQSPPASRLIRDCVSSPPARDLRTGSFNRPTPYYRRDDARLRELERLYRAAEPAIDTPAWTLWLMLPPQRVVRQAIEQSNRKDAA